MRVTVHRLNRSFEDEEVGSISWDGKKMTADGSPAVKEISTTPIIVGVKGKVVHVGPDSPQAFLQLLHRQYHSPYLRVSEATEK